MNLDDGVFEVYRGFNEGKLKNGKVQPARAEGRYAQLLDDDDRSKAAALEAANDTKGYCYFGVSLLAAFSLKKLPAESTFLRKLEKLEEN